MEVLSIFPLLTIPLGILGYFYRDLISRSRENRKLIDNLAEDINELAVKVAELKAKTDYTREQLVDMDKMLDKIIDNLLQK